MPELGAALTALQVAIQTEIDGHAFYSRLAAQTEDPSAQAVFSRLAQDEVMHLELLRNTQALLTQGGAWAEMKTETEEVQPAPIFSRERVQQNLVGYTSDLSALRVAYLMEKDAVDFYTRAAAKTGDPNGQRMFGNLAKMEGSHLRLLEGEYTFLRSQFQHAMGFSPF